MTEIRQFYLTHLELKGLHIITRIQEKEGFHLDNIEHLSKPQLAFIALEEYFVEFKKERR